MRGRGGKEGFSLIEVCIALALLTMALLPLVQITVALTQRTIRLDRRVETASSSPSSEPAGNGFTDWTWGPRSGLLSWGEGPQLEADLRVSGCEQGQWLGFWVNGWFEGEYRTGEDDHLALGSCEFWRTHEGDEVVVRARRPDGAWGAPTRTTVPAVDGTGSWPSEGPGAPAGSLLSAALVHLPAAGGASIHVSAEVGSLLVDMEAGPTSISVGCVGPVSMALGTTIQAWLSEEARDVDLYF